MFVLIDHSAASFWWEWALHYLNVSGMQKVEFRKFILEFIDVCCVSYMQDF